MMIRIPVSDTLLYRKLAHKGFLVRTMTGFRFPWWIRVSLVQRPVMEEFCRGWKRLCAGEVVRDGLSWVQKSWLNMRFGLFYRSENPNGIPYHSPGLR